MKQTISLVTLLLPLMAAMAEFYPYYDYDNTWVNGNTHLYAVAGEYEDTKCAEFKKKKHRRQCECYWVTRMQFECYKEGFSWDSLTLQPSKAPTTPDQITQRPSRPPTTPRTPYPTRKPTVSNYVLTQQLEETNLILNNTLHTLAQVTQCAKKKCLKKRGLNNLIV